MGENITEHFTVTEMLNTRHKEFVQENDCYFFNFVEPMVNMARICTILELVRTLYGHPIIVTSGFRCESLNAAVGGVPNSLHTYGAAVDILYDVRLVEILTTFKKNGWIKELVVNRKKQYIHIGITRVTY